MKKYLSISVYFMLVFTLILSSCTSDGDSKDTNSVTAISLTTTAASLVNKTTATVGGKLLSTGGGIITSRGICYSTEPNPTTEDLKISNPGAVGTFVCRLSDLSAGTQYFVRAYASNSAGLYYGNEITFITTTELLAAPTVTTSETTAITQTTATSGGNVISAGGTDILSRGICWATSENPTILNNVVESTGTTGIFSSSLIGLNPETTYYVRAYATNSIGTSYGNQISFTTDATTTIDVPEVLTTDATAVTATSAISGGDVVSIGGAPITARGICWATTDNPSLTDNVITDPATTTGEYISNLTGLTPGTIYFVRAFATNAAGTSYGDVIVFSTL